MTVDQFSVLDADEGTMLAAMLDFHRDAQVRKTQGLKDTQLRYSPIRTGTNLLGLVYHLTRTEKWWFEGVFEGQPFEGGPPHEHDAPPGSGPAQIVQGFLAQCARGREIASDAQLDDASKKRLHAASPALDHGSHVRRDSPTQRTR